MRAIPQKAVNFVAQHEGMQLTAYLDSGNLATIGVGHVDGVQLGDVCTKSQALKWLAEDMGIAQRKLYAALKPEVIDSFTDNQWSALLSFAFNVGFSSKWAICRKLNAKQYDQVPAELAKFCNAGGKKVLGLVKRRADETVLWSTDEPGTTQIMPTSAVTRGPGVTPPTPAPVVPMHKNPLVAGALGFTAAAAPMIDQATKVVSPYAERSELVQRALGTLAAIGAVLAVVSMVLLYLKNKN
jgi:lysozyme